MTDERQDLATTSVPGLSTLGLVDVEGITDASTPYPAAVRHGDLLFVSGQVSFTDEGTVAHEGDVRGQIKRSLERLERILVAAGTRREAVASATVYLTDAEDAVALNEEWRTWFGQHRPARATVVARLLDARLLVEISAIATVPAAQGVTRQ